MSNFFTTRSLKLAVASMLWTSFGLASTPASDPASNTASTPETTSLAPTEKPEAAPEKKQLTKEELLTPQFLSKLAQTYGHMVAKSLDNPIIKLNIDDVIAGLKEAKAGKEAPLSPKEYDQAMMLLQRHLSEEMTKKFNDEAEKFLKDNASKEGVIQLKDGKLQYKVVQEGLGDAVVTKDTLAKIKYNISQIDGTSLGSSEHGAIEIDAANTLPALRDGIMGMKVGEKRRLFIHPELARGISHTATGLVIFDVEVESIAPKPIKTAQNEKGDLVADAEDEDEDDGLGDDEDELMDEYGTDDDIDQDDDFDSEKIAQIIASMEDEDDDDSDDNEDDDNE